LALGISVLLAPESVGNIEVVLNLGQAGGITVVVGDKGYIWHVGISCLRVKFVRIIL